MNGDLPPSSNDTGVRLRGGVAVDRARGRGRAGERDPVDVPVAGQRRARAGRRCRGRCSARRAAARPRSARSPSIEHVSGAHSGGFSTTVLPAASAGPTRQVASMNGAFHGVETATTPAGSWRTRLRSPPGSVRAARARGGRARSRRRSGCCWRRAAAPARASPRAASRCRRTRPGQVGDGGVDRVGEPREMRVASRRVRALAHSGKARRAAATAASTSACPPAATSASFQPSQSIGLRTSNVVSLPTRRPSM